MFSLIVTIFALVLVAGIALATLYYGGDIFQESSADADAARYINQGQHITAAVRLYQAEKAGDLPQDLEADLVPDYLRMIPKEDFDWSIGEDTVLKSVSNPTVCERVNVKAGMADPTPVSCSSVPADQTYFCCIPDSPAR